MRTKKQKPIKTKHNRLNDKDMISRLLNKYTAMNLSIKN